MPNLNYVGSSGFGTRPDGTYGPVYTAPPDLTHGAAATDYPVYDISTGKNVSVKTGKPWVGPFPVGWVDAYSKAAGGGRGVQVPFAPAGTEINPNDPSQRYRAANIVKQPDVAGAQSELMKTFQDTAQQSLKGFSDYLKTFQTDLSNARGATAAATNITPTVNALTQAQAGYASDLSGANTAYQQALAESAARQRGVVGEAQGLLPMYDTAAKNAEDAQLAALQRQLSQYKITTGTPTSLGGDEERMLLQGVQNIMLPIEQAKINQRYSILSGMALPVESNIGGANINYAGSFLPGIAGSKYGSARDLATTIQNLKTQVANMSTQQAIAFMQAQGIPAQIMQQVLSGQISELGGLSNLESLSNYQGLQDILGAYPSQPVGYNVSTPGYPMTGPRYPTSANTLGANPPSVVSPARSGVLGDISGGIPYAPLPGSIGGAPYTPQSPVPTYSPIPQSNLTPEQYQQLFATVNSMGY